MNIRDKQEIAAYQKTITLIKKGYGGSHTKKHTYDFDISCVECQSAIAISFLWRAIDGIEGFSENTRRKGK